MMRRRILLFCLGMTLLNSSFAQKWKLVWLDEFNYDGLPDSGKWSYETRGNATGWGNNEKQFYTEANPLNAVANKGSLKITACKESTGNKEYTSAYHGTRGLRGGQRSWYHSLRRLQPYTGNPERQGRVSIHKPYSKFHIYAIVWSPEKIDFILDGKKNFSFPNEHKTEQEWPFDQPFYMILNLAIGGDWGGKKGIDQTIFPAIMEVDYVRVYQKQ